MPTTRGWRDPLTECNWNDRVESLPPGYRMIFLLHDVEGYEHNEIAQIVGCSIGNSGSRDCTRRG